MHIVCFFYSPNHLFIEFKCSPGGKNSGIRCCVCLCSRKMVSRVNGRTLKARPRITATESKAVPKKKRKNNRKTDEKRKKNQTPNFPRGQAMANWGCRWRSRLTWPRRRRYPPLLGGGEDHPHQSIDDEWPPRAELHEANKKCSFESVDSSAFGLSVELSKLWWAPVIDPNWAPFP